MRTVAGCEYQPAIDYATVENARSRLVDCRFIDDKPHWHDDHIDKAAGKELVEQGYVVHSLTFKLGRALLNEVL